MSGNELISEVRTRAMGLETCTKFLILDMCDRLERKTRDCELLRQKVVKLLPQKPMTNADRIRDTDDELATMLHAVKLGFAPWCDYHCENEGDDGCDNCIKKWQPAEGDA